MYAIGCHCGHHDDIDLFTHSPSGKALPRDTYQCPRCYRAWRIEPVGQGWYTPEGLWIPPEKVFKRVIPTL